MLGRGETADAYDGHGGTPRAVEQQFGTVVADGLNAFDEGKLLVDPWPKRLSRRSRLRAAHLGDRAVERRKGDRARSLVLDARQKLPRYPEARCDNSRRVSRMHT